MASRIDPLEKITPVRECWRVKIRVIQMWYLPNFNNPNTINNIVMIFMDEYGCTMHAYVRKTLIYKFKPLLSEREGYVIAYFGVGGNTGSFRMTRHKFRLNLELRTTMKPSESDVIPRYGCKLVPFDDIFQSNGDFPFLVDVIGVLSSISSEKEYDKEGKKVKMIVNELEADSVKLEVALFGDYVHEVNNFIANGDVQQPVIVVQFARVKTFKGQTVET